MPPTNFAPLFYFSTLVYLPSPAVPRIQPCPLVRSVMSLGRLSHNDLSHFLFSFCSSSLPCFWIASLSSFPLPKSPSSLPACAHALYSRRQLLPSDIAPPESARSGAERVCSICSSLWLVSCLVTHSLSLTSIPSLIEIMYQSLLFAYTSRSKLFLSLDPYLFPPPPDCAFPLL